MFTPFSKAGLNMVLAKKLLALVAMKKNRGIMSISKFCEFQVAALNCEFSWTPDLGTASCL